MEVPCPPASAVSNLPVGVLGAGGHVCALAALWRAWRPWVVYFSRQRGSIFLDRGQWHKEGQKAAVGAVLGGLINFRAHVGAGDLVKVLAASLGPTALEAYKGADGLAEALTAS